MTWQYIISLLNLIFSILWQSRCSSSGTVMRDDRAIEDECNVLLNSVGDESLAAWLWGGSLRSNWKRGLVKTCHISSCKDQRMWSKCLQQGYSKLVELSSKYLTIMHRFCLFVCSIYKLAPLQGAPRNMSCTLRGAWSMFLEDYLPCGRTTVKFFRLEDRDVIFIWRHAVYRRSKEHLGRATTCPVSAKIAPESLGQGTERQYYFFIWHHADSFGNLGCAKYCKDGRENTYRMRGTKLSRFSRSGHHPRIVYSANISNKCCEIVKHGRRTVPPCTVIAVVLDRKYKYGRRFIRYQLVTKFSLY